jgi:hypothetical protein
MRPGINQAVAIGRTTTQEAALLHHLSPHRRQHPKPRTQHLPLDCAPNNITNAR